HIARKHQRVPLDVRKFRVHYHRPDASDATGALRPSEISCIAGVPPWDAACPWAQGGFRRVPKFSPALEMFSSSVFLRNHVESQSQKPKCAPIAKRSATQPHVRRRN